MKGLKILTLLFILILLTWGIQLLYLSQRNASITSRIKSGLDCERESMALDYKRKVRDLELEYETKKHLATGITVYDRIFNTQAQSVTDLIRRIADEALPNDWSCDVKVEEFTHFILLIYLPHNAVGVSPAKVTSYLPPILKYCSRYLSDIAVFDQTHKSYLFFDNEILNYLKKYNSLTSAFAKRVIQQGESFTSFNSVSIQGKILESHLFLPVEVVGSDGIVTCQALFDTGANITMLSNEIVTQTCNADLKDAPLRNFSTANGQMSCPIVKREVIIAGFRRNIEVAVNQLDGVNLVGLNFFEGMDYIVDFRNSCIYVWEK